MYLYRAYDRAGRLLYLGMTSCIYQRVKGHRRTSKWYRDVQSWEVVDLGRSCSWHTARDAEARAIRAEDPIHNVVHSPRWRRTGRSGWVRDDQAKVAA